MKTWKGTGKERLWEERRDWRIFTYQPVKNGNYWEKRK
jgi:hypothetical protein